MRCSPFIFLLLVSCSASVTTNEIFVEQEALQSMEFRQAENEYSVPEEETSVYVIRNSICTFYRTDKSKPALVLSPIGSDEQRWFVSHGYEEDQMLLPALSFGGGDALLYDPVLKKACRIDVDAALEDDQYEPLYHDTNIVSQRVVPVGDRLLYLNHYSYDGSERRLLWSDSRWNETGHHKTKSKSKNYLNVLSGDIVYQEGENMAFISRHTPEIEIYGWNGELAVKLVFPHQVPSTAEVINSVGQRETVFTSLVTSFVSSASFDDYFVTCFRDDFGQDFIIVLSWQGEIVDGFKVRGAVKTVSIGRDGVFVYGKDGDTWVLKEYPLVLCQAQTVHDEDSSFMSYVDAGMLSARESPKVEANILVADLADALYTVKRGKVVSITRW